MLLLLSPGPNFDSIITSHNVIHNWLGIRRIIRMQRMHRHHALPVMHLLMFSIFSIARITLACTHNRKIGPMKWIYKSYGSPLYSIDIS
jgi:hypothetical protein